ncbi:MAG TPA: hypothetical protein DCE78_05845 [Bacteroidetes bacterium]|nr:hypothetical protein [Bacteroidota bacterium]
MKSSSTKTTLLWLIFIALISAPIFTLSAQLPVVTSNGIVIGKVTNATNNQAIPGVIVSIGDIHSTTNVTGDYRLEGIEEGEIRLTFSADVTSGPAPLQTNFNSDLREGTQTITADVDGYSTYEYDGLIVLGDETTTHNISLSPRLTGAEMRFVLTWGATPRDLDSHLRTPTGYKVYYNARGSSTAPPYATLDVDDTNGHGPETVTIFQLIEGTYHYFVYNYTNEANIITSNAVVTIYTEDGSSRTLEIPTSGTGRYWYVATVDGSTGRYQIINRIQDTEPGISSKDVGTDVAKDEISATWTYEWDFGDNTTASGSNPSHTYSETGLYTVSLTATDGTNTISITEENYIVVTGTGTGTVFGVVRNATNNQVISGVTVILDGQETTTNASGEYRFDDVDESTVQVLIDADTYTGFAALRVNFESSFRAGFHAISASASGYASYLFEGLSVVSGQSTEHNISLSPVLTDAELRFVLTWGANPEDLDSHLLTPSGYHLYYNARGSATASPFVTLDVDDTDGFGPETVTIFQRMNGTYHYYIYNYSGSPDITTSNAIVRIYSRQGTSQTLNIPTSGTGRYWYVATVDGASGHVTIVNRIQASPPTTNAKATILEAKEVSSEIMSGWSYEWDFGDDTESIEANPSHLYLEPGLYTVKLTARNGDVVVTSERNNFIEVVLNTSLETDLAYTFRLLGNYPNPFNPTSSIRFEIPESGAVQVEIFNATGQLITTLNERYLPAGLHSMPVNASSWSSGIYLYTLQFADKKLVGKMTLIK